MLSRKAERSASGINQGMRWSGEVRGYGCLFGNGHGVGQGHMPRH